MEYHVKTIFARMGEIKDYGATLEDNTSANSVSKALDSIGISLFDTTGQMRDLDDVLMDVGERWSTLDSIQQKYITTALAGSRQQTRLISIFQDWDKTMKYVQASSESAGATLAQQAKYTESMQYSLEKLNNAWEALIKGMSSSEFFITVVDVLTELLKVLENISPLILPIATGLAAIFGAGNNITSGFITVLTSLIKGDAKAFADSIFGKGLENIKALGIAIVGSFSKLKTFISLLPQFISSVGGAKVAVDTLTGSTITFGAALQAAAPALIIISFLAIAAITAFSK